MLETKSGMFASASSTIVISAVVSSNDGASFTGRTRIVNGTVCDVKLLSPPSSKTVSLKTSSPNTFSAGTNESLAVPLATLDTCGAVRKSI